MIFDLPTFIATHITGRQTSLLAADLADFRRQLRAGINGRRVLVIGGAGTIGSSFIRALLTYGPAGLVVVDTNENGLTELTRDLRSRPGTKVPSEYRTYPIDFSGSIFARFLQQDPPFQIVANFAAHKHVRSEKDIYSIEAMLRNNVIDAVGLLRRLRTSPPERFFCVSSDKAANPANVMGASKKLMEMAIFAHADEFPITTARFANVAFSQGDLLSGFLNRLLRRQPLSAPRDLRRFFLSPDEAGELCLLACMCGETGDVFFPKLSVTQTRTFTEIADRFVEAHGLSPKPFPTEDAARHAAAAWQPGDPYPVHYFTSDTSGEKAIEEFYTELETIDSERFINLGVVKNAPRLSAEEIDQTCEGLSAVCRLPTSTKADFVAALAAVLPSFDHLETGRGLDQRM